MVKNCSLNKNSASLVNEIDQEKSKVKTDAEPDEEIALTMSMPMIQEPNTGSGWFDSACTKHMSCDKGIIYDYYQYKKPTKEHLGDNTVIFAYGEEKVRLPTHNGPNTVNLALHKVLYVPKLSKNLLSVPAMALTGAEVRFDKTKCVVIKDGKEFIIGHIVNDKLYRVNTDEYAHFLALSSVPTMQTWHCRYGHLNYGYVNKLLSKDLVEGMKYSDTKSTKECQACALGKMHRNAFPNQSMNRAIEILQIIHSDVCGPMQVDSMGGSRYMLTFIDDFSQYCTVYLIKSKDEVLTKFKNM